MQTATERWSVLLVLIFFAGFVFLFFHLYLRPQTKPTEVIVQEETPTLEAPTVSIINPSRGPENAPLTIVEFGDYQCEACRDMAVSLDTIRRESPDKIRLIWKDLPNESLHTEATAAAIAARCAGEQGAFWTYQELLFTQMTLLGSSTYDAIARALELNMDAFSRCVSNKTPLPKIQRDYEEALALSITATPTVFLGNERIVGAISIDELRSMVQTFLGNL